MFGIGDREEHDLDEAEGEGEKKIRGGEFCLGDTCVLQTFCQQVQFDTGENLLTRSLTYDWLGTSFHRYFARIEQRVQ